MLIKCSGTRLSRLGNFLLVNYLIATNEAEIFSLTSEGNNWNSFSRETKVSSFGELIKSVCFQSHSSLKS